MQTLPIFRKGSYRPGVGVALTNRDGQILVGQRIDFPSQAWQMPQGGIDEGEAPLDAALREMEEEIGTRKAHLLYESPNWYYYDLPPELRHLWGGRYRGQQQKWFLFRFLGEDRDINLQTAHPEFSAWRWVDPALVPQLIVPFKRQLYVDLFAELAPFL